MTVYPIVVVFTQGENVIDVIIYFHRANNIPYFMFQILKYQGAQWIDADLKYYVVHGKNDIPNKVVNCKFACKVG